MEWIPFDVNTHEKPEVLELIEITGEPVEVVVYRLYRLWAWASLQTADGTIRTTPRRLAALFGGDERFWSALESVGWARFDGASMQIVGWDRRFGNAAKARALKNRRQARWRRSGDADASHPGDACEAQARLPDKTRQDEKREKTPSESPETKPPRAVRSPATEALPAIEWSVEGGWTGVSSTDRAQWAAAYPGAILDRELAKAHSWLVANPKRAGRRNWRRFLTNWLARCQERGGTDRGAGANSDADRVAAAEARWNRRNPVVDEHARLRREKADRLRREREDAVVTLADALGEPPGG